MLPSSVFGKSLTGQPRPAEPLLEYLFVWFGLGWVGFSGLAANTKNQGNNSKRHLNFLFP